MSSGRPRSSSPARARESSPGPSGNRDRGRSQHRDDRREEEDQYWTDEDWYDFYGYWDEKEDDHKDKKTHSSQLSTVSSSYKGPPRPSDPGDGGGGHGGPGGNGPPNGPNGPPGGPPNGPPNGPDLPDDGGGPPQPPPGPDIPRRKEAEKVGVPAFPKVETVERWKTNLLYSIQEASAYADNSEIKWLKQVWQPGTKLFDLESSKIDVKFKTLDQKLAKACRQLINEQGPPMLKTQLNQLTVANVMKDQLTSGLQHVWSILDHLRTGDGMTTLVETRELWNLEFKGDAQMLEYRTRWTYITSSLTWSRWSPKKSNFRS